MQPSKSTHNQSLLDVLAEAIRRRSIDNSLTLPAAAARVSLQWLGYDLEEDSFIDSRDRGVDAYSNTDTSLDLFQVKSHEFTPEGYIKPSTFNGEGLQDLMRARIMLLHEQERGVTTKALQQLLQRWAAILGTHTLSGNTAPIPVTLHLVVLGDGLTASAQREFAAFQQELMTPAMVKQTIPVQFRAVLHTIDAVIDARWRQQNREWKDVHGKTIEAINLQPWGDSTISDHRHAVFYCRAIDLVTAYKSLGYQLFEPNVRANIRASRVNEAIRTSVLHQRSRRDFRFLNNGVTIICDSFQKPAGQRKHFAVRKPGIVNGLQTVVALSTAFEQLDEDDRVDFSENCAVLVRLLLHNAVDDISQVVRSTNNQNPMKPRNLVSNSPEQLFYARIFADELNWFYEAKEGAWEAFDKDPRRWRPALNKTSRDFAAIRPQGGRPRIRRVDNEDLAQAWLSFTGFSFEAINQRREIFDKLYTFIFQRQSLKHGMDYEFQLSRANEEAVEQSPAAHLMLVAYLAQRFADDIVPPSSQYRKEAIARLRIDERTKSRAEVDIALSQDAEFVVMQALSGMSVLFSEFVGFVLFRVFGDGLHRLGGRILQNHSFKQLATSYDVEAIAAKLRAESIDPHDILAVLWLLFVNTVEDFVNGEWGDRYRTAVVKSRFIYSRESRAQLYKALQQTDTFMRRRSIKQLWALGVNEGEGLFDFIRRCFC